MTQATIITAAINQPDFIILQDALIKKFCAHPVRFVVVNDAKEKADSTNLNNADVVSDIEKICRSHGIEHYRMPQELHGRRDKLFLKASKKASDTPHHRTSAAVQWGLKNVAWPSNDVVMVIDSDMFPVRGFSLHHMLAGNELAGVWQRRERCGLFRKFRVDYLWSGIFVINCRILPNKEEFNMECGKVNGLTLDCGGFLYYYFLKNIGVRITPIDHLMSCYWGAAEVPEWMPLALRSFLETDNKNVAGRYYAEIYADKFFHFRAGGNWDGSETAQLRARQDSLIS